MTALESAANLTPGLPRHGREHEAGDDPPRIRRAASFRGLSVDGATTQNALSNPASVPEAAGFASGTRWLVHFGAPRNVHPAPPHQAPWRFSGSVRAL